MIRTPCTASISPDGRTPLSVGDSPHVYLHGMTGGARITFTPLAQLSLPPFDPPSTNAPSPLPRLPHIPVPHLHTHPHGHYYHHMYNAAPLVGHTGGDRERCLLVRVRQIRDVLLTSASPVSASGSGVTSVTTTATAAPTPSRRRSRMEASAGAGTTDMDVDVDTDDGDEAEAEVETDCLTSRAPSRAASSPLRQRRLAVHSGRKRRWWAGRDHAARDG
jgi:hypothetical protein